jgi:tetratricopeptide (TPR) repeat protein
VRPVLNIDLLPACRVGLALVLVASPLFRGLFFDPEMLLAGGALGFLGVLWFLDRLAKAEGVLGVPGGRRFSLPWLAPWGAVALAGFYVLTVLWAVDPQAATRGAIKALAYLLVFLIAHGLSTNEAGARSVLKVALVGAVVVGIIGIGCAAGVMEFPGAVSGKSIASTLQYENALAGFALAAATVGMGLWTTCLYSPRERRGGLHAMWAGLTYAAAEYILVLLILGSRSRGGWVIFPLSVAALMSGLPGRLRWRCLYCVFLVFSAGVLSGKRFYAAAFRGLARTGEALSWFGVGLAIAVIGEVLYWVWGVVWRRVRAAEMVEKVLRAVAVAYALLAIAVYFGYAVTQLPLGMRQALPAAAGEAVSTLSLDDPNFVTYRMYASRDALRIVRDRPWGAGAGGWNALYHQYQGTLYWSTEVHNHFLQVWVEAGTGGFIAFLAVWVGTGAALWWLGRKASSEGSWSLAWSAGVAAFALGLHSAFDFDLSLPAVSFYLWALLGTVAGLHCGYARARERVQRSGARSQGKDGAPAYGASPRWRRFAAAALGFVLSALMAWGSARFYSAGVLGAEAARAMRSGDLAVAEAKFRKASALDPFTASFAVDLAQIYSVVGIVHAGSGPYFDRAEQELRRALRVQPYSVPVRTAVCSVLLQAGKVDDAVREAEAVVRILPLATEPWEGLARVYVAAARFHLTRGAEAAARDYLGRLDRLREDMESVKDRGRGVRPELFRGPRWTPALQLASAQSAFLKGDFARALDLLEQVKGGDNEVQKTARLWAAACRQRLGQVSEASEILRKVTSEDPAAEAEFRALVEQAVAGS